MCSIEAERISLALGRLREVSGEHVLTEPYGRYFRKAAESAVFVYDNVTSIKGADTEKKRSLNRELFRELSPDGYVKSYLDPGFAAAELGEYGPLLSFLYYELRGLIPFCHEYVYYSTAGEKYAPFAIMRAGDIAMLLEVLLEMYSCFMESAESGTKPALSAVHDILYWFVSDYCDVTMAGRVREQLDPDMDFATALVMGSDLSDAGFLYDYGEYVTEYEERTAGYLASLPEERIQLMADTFTGGYIRGFAMTGKDISIKKTVNIRYQLGFERVIRAAVNNFEKEGLKCILYRSPVHLACGRVKTGYFGALSRQCEYDHSEDMALFLDKALVDRRLSLLQEAYRDNADAARVHGGPAVLETFGEKPFSPVSGDKRPRYSEKQQELCIKYSTKAGEIVNEYIPGEERSYTIISFPDARMGDLFEKVFDETVVLNTLDYKEYERIQQALIDLLDPGVYVKVKGKAGNRTDLKVALRSLPDLSRQTQFENCTADVNIPVGEVFTSPVLEGTDGILHVKKVFLDSLEYRELWFELENGYVKDYGCDNFDTREEGMRYIRKEILNNHDTLPLGEFAIGTNTTAYAMARRYDIFDRLQILIAEKTGPHFALGDTCYSRSEDIAVFNPDGREIVSRSNAASDAGTYFNCHTDVTIPFDELGSLSVVWADGSVHSIIEDGLFVAQGTEKLNVPLRS